MGVGDEAQSVGAIPVVVECQRGGRARQFEGPPGSDAGEAAAGAHLASGAGIWGAGTEDRAARADAASRDRTRLAKLPGRRYAGEPDRTWEMAARPAGARRD